MKKITRYTLEAFVAAVVSFGLAAGFGFYGAIRPAKAPSDLTPGDFGIEYRTVFLRTADGLNLAAWHIPRVGGSDGSAIVALHGYPADKGDILPHVIAWAADYDLLLVDFRYFGASDGSYTAAGARETLDLAAALDYLRAQGLERIGVYGFSMGGAVALLALADRPEIAAVVAEAPYAELVLMIDELYRNFGPLRRALTWTNVWAARWLFGIDARSVSPARALAGSSRPVLLIHGRDDRVVPFRHAEIIREALAGSPAAEFWFYEGGHGLAPREFSQRTSDFFARFLR